MFDVLETRELDELGKLVSRRSNELILCIFIGAPRLALHVVDHFMSLNFTGTPLDTDIISLLPLHFLLI